MHADAAAYILSTWQAQVWFARRYSTNTVNIMGLPIQHSQIHVRSCMEAMTRHLISPWHRSFIMDCRASQSASARRPASVIFHHPFPSAHGSPTAPRLSHSRRSSGRTARNAVSLSCRSVSNCIAVRFDIALFPAVRYRTMSQRPADRAFFGKLAAPTQRGERKRASVASGWPGPVAAQRALPRPRASMGPDICTPSRASSAESNAKSSPELTHRLANDPGRVRIT